MSTQGEDTRDMTARLIGVASGEIGQMGGRLDDETTRAVAGSDDLAELLKAARTAFEQVSREAGSGGPGGPGGGGLAGKPGKRNAGLMAVMALLGAVATGAGSYAVLQATVADNAGRIEAHEAIKMHDGDAEYMEAVKGEIGGIKTRMEAVEDGQRKIADGIDELKRENIDRLKKDLERAEAELRRRRRGDR